MTVLRVYDPADCDQAGVPLDWESCRRCAGEGVVPALHPTGVARRDAETRCPACGGHGSLKAAALADKTPNRGAITAAFPTASAAIPESAWTLRCEDCGHPMSEGTWEPTRGADWPSPEASLMVARDELLASREPTAMLGVHYSPCDEGCRHDSVSEENTGLRWADTGEPVYDPVFDDEPAASQGVSALVRIDPVEASWRQVDVRTLGWPHDLRSEKLAVLCLRCWAARSDA